MSIGPFEILQELGAGSGGTVCLARRAGSGRMVVLKQLSRHVPANDPGLERIRREIADMSALGSDRLVTLYGAEVVDGRPVLEMEYLPNGTLRRAVSAGPVPLQQVIRITEDVLSALKAIHDAWRLHRAVRPSNIFLDGTGGAKLADARLSMAEVESVATLRPATIAFIAPECLNGQAATVRSDLYSVGMVAYEALLGTVEFQAAFPELKLVEALADKWLGWTADPSKVAPPLHVRRTDIPAPVSQFVARLMAKDSDLRFASADDALHALREIVELPAGQVRLGDGTLSSLRDDPEPPPRPILPPESRPAPPVAANEPAPQAVHDTVYFMMLVGGIAGLCCWATTTWTADYLTLRQEATPLLLTLWTTIMGALIGGMTVGFADARSADRVVARWLVAGLLLGTVAGALSGLLYMPIQLNVVAAGLGGALDTAARTALWAIAGCLIGLAAGLRWYAVNPARAVHAALGGILGGTAGGMVFQYTAHVHEVFAALAFILVGMGISLGVALAPVLARDGVLQFVRSGDPLTQDKYGRQQQQWPVQDGDRLIIGNEGAGMATTLYARNVHVFMPDATMAPRHAILFERNKRFYVQPHPENIGNDGRVDAPLTIGATEIGDTRELRHGDDIRMGQTVFRFFLTKAQRRKGAGAAKKASVAR